MISNKIFLTLIIVTFCWGCDSKPPLSSIQERYNNYFEATFDNDSIFLYENYEVKNDFYYLNIISKYKSDEMKSIADTIRQTYFDANLNFAVELLEIIPRIDEKALNKEIRIQIWGKDKDETLFKWIIDSSFDSKEEYNAKGSLMAESGAIQFNIDGIEMLSNRDLTNITENIDDFVNEFYRVREDKSGVQIFGFCLFCSSTTFKPNINTIKKSQRENEYIITNLKREISPNDIGQEKIRLTITMPTIESLEFRCTVTGKLITNGTEEDIIIYQGMIAKEKRYVKRLANQLKNQLEN